MEQVHCGICEIGLNADIYWYNWLYGNDHTEMYHKITLFNLTGIHIKSHYKHHMT